MLDSVQTFLRRCPAAALRGWTGEDAVERGQGGADGGTESAGPAVKAIRCAGRKWRARQDSNL